LRDLHVQQDQSRDFSQQHRLAQHHQRLCDGIYFCAADDDGAGHAGERADGQCVRRFQSNAQHWRQRRHRDRHDVSVARRADASGVESLHVKDRRDRIFMSVALALVGAIIFATPAYSQKKTRARKPKATQSQPPSTELSKLRDSYISATKEYKASLEKLQSLYQESVKKAELQRDKMARLLAEGLIAKKDLEQAETVLAAEKMKVRGVESQIGSADAQIAQTLIEIERSEER